MGYYKVSVMWNIFNSLSIRYKLLLYFLVLILLPILTIGLLTNVIFSDTLENTAMESTVQMISQANVNIETKIKSMANIMDIVIRHPQVLEFLRARTAGDPEMKAITESTVRSFLAGITENNKDIEGIALVSASDSFLSNELYKVLQDPLTEEEWYKASIAEKGGFTLAGSPIGRKITEYKKVSADEIITLTKAVIDPSNGSIIGVILMDLNLNPLKEMLKNIKLGKVGFIYIVGSDGEPLYSPVNKIVPRVRNNWFEDPSGVFTKYIRNQRFQFIYTISPYTKWKVVGVFSLNETLKDVADIRYYTLIILLLVTLVAISISVIFSSSIAKPIGKLRSLMKKAESGDLSVVFDVRYNDEIGQLGRSFNAMIAEIKNLIDVVYKEQKSKREAELRTLQSQIKPHFLYNTLGAVYWMAKDSGASDVMQMVSALTNLFRIGLSKGNEVISLAEEIEHVRSYLVILKIRYAEMLDYDISVDESLKSLLVQKLILQPIVENAVYHGIKEKGGPGRIEVSVRKTEEFLLLTVKDDGVGISGEALQAINSALEDGNKEKSGYGIFNVNERIRLSYGKDYGVNLWSTLGKGTTVEIRHPIISK